MRSFLTAPDMFIVIIPKNSRLECCRQIGQEIADKNDSKLIELRGEDIPFFCNELINQGKNAIGIIPEDLFEEFRIGNPRNNLSIFKRVIWNEGIFGKPTLCLLGPESKNLEKGDYKVVIDSKYKKISKCYLNRLEKQGYSFQKIYVRGSCEEMFLNGMCDLIIDIVLTGNSAKKAGLAVYDKIFSSDIALIGGKNENL